MSIENVKKNMKYRTIQNYYTATIGPQKLRQKLFRTNGILTSEQNVVNELKENK
jgi:hypothetical protein